MPMSNQNLSHNKTNKILRWAARVLGSLIAFFWFFIVIVNLITEPALPHDPESIIMTALIFCSVIGVVIAWFYEIPGGIVLLVIAFAHSINAVITAGHNKGLAVLIAGGPFLVIGILFILSGRDSQ